ncbi:MAG: DUF2231 domain-containing protein [Sphingomonadales bacterium]
MYHALKSGLFSVAFALVVVLSPAQSYGHSAEEMGAGPGEPVREQPVTPADQSPDAHDHMAGSDGHDHTMPMNHHAASNEHRTFGARLVNWLGRLHVTAIHFPIAMILGGLAVEIYGAARKTERYQDAARTMLVVGAIGAGIAVMLGWFAGGFFLSDRNQILTIHRWLGTAIAIVAALLVCLAVRRRTKPGTSRTVYWVILCSLAVALSVQGFLGGTFMHGGLRHLAF